MSLSGGPVAALCTFYSVPAEQLLVVHDELDLPEHTLRLKRGGGSGGQDGVKSITSAHGTPDYVRKRAATVRRPRRMHPADYVLHNVRASATSDGADEVGKGD